MLERFHNPVIEGVWSCGGCEVRGRCISSLYSHLKLVVEMLRMMLLVTRMVLTMVDGARDVKPSNRCELEMESCE